MTEDSKKIESKIENKDAYKFALDTRNFEIALFWQRSNYFLVLNSALALGFFNLQKQEYAWLLAVFGFLASYLWFQVNLGSKYWQVRWENRLSIFENEVSPGLNFFSANWQTIQKDVEDSLGNTRDDKGSLRKWVDKQVLKKPSVSYNMTLLSLGSMLAWALLAVIRIWKTALQ